MTNLKDFLRCLRPLANLTAKILLFIFVLSFNLFAQQDTSKTTNSLTQQDTTAFVMHKSPWGAVLRSAVIPGWGQLYNHSYWKAPIVWGFIGFYAYYWKVNNDKYKEWRDIYKSTLIEKYKSNRDSYHDQRDLVALYMGITYFLNLIDAYVDAQLFDFTVDESPYIRAPQIGLKIHF